MANVTQMTLFLFKLYKSKIYEIFFTRNALVTFSWNDPNIHSDRGHKHNNLHVHLQCISIMSLM